MPDDNAAVYWLILATSISSVTTTLLYIFQKCFGQFWGNMSTLCFQSFAASLELREETFHQVTNLLIFPRILQQLRLQSFKVIWCHDANAQTGDFVQWGWIRLPTKTYLLAFLAVCGVTHYVYIPCDLSRVEIVAPAEAIAKLIDLSNVAATTRLTEAQLDVLRHAFGMDSSWTKADMVCARWERRFVRCMLGSFCMVLCWKMQGDLPLFMATVVGFAAAGLCACWYTVGSARSVFSHFSWHRRRAHAASSQGERDGITQLSHSMLMQEMEEGHIDPQHGLTPTLCEFAASSQADAEFFQAVPAASSQADADIDSSVPCGVEPGRSKIIYSVLAARSYFYEVVKQTSVVPKPESCIVTFAEDARMYAVEMQPNFVHYLAERTAIPNNASLHIGIYNPMLDPYLIEVYQNFQKGVDRENLLMIILPPLDHFDSSFDSPVLARSRTAKCTQFVTTRADFETLLLQMTAGFMPKLVFVLPVCANTHAEHSAAPFQVWLSSEHVLGASNCHWA